MIDTSILPRRSSLALGTLACLAAILAPASARAGTTYFPGAGEFGTLLFEDNWPCAGDRDFNDAVVRYNVAVLTDVNGLATELVATFDVQAMGTSQCNAIALHLPVDAVSVNVTTVRGTPGSADGAPWSSPAPAMIAPTGNGEAVVVLADDVRADLCDGSSGFINTDPAAPVSDCGPLSLRVVFSLPTALPADEPYDLFIHRCGDRTHQIHRSSYYGVVGGTFDVDAALFGTCDDASDPPPPLGQHWYVQGPSAVEGLPWVLDIPESDFAVWPKETVRIDQVFPDIIGFASSGGTSGTDWYKSTVNEDALFRSGAEGLPPLPPILFPVCANQIVETPETCDDGNSAGGDGCSARCRQEASQSDEQQGCINALNKSGYKLDLLQGKAIASCVKNAGKGSETDPNACPLADAKGKLRKAVLKTLSTDVKRCGAVVPGYGPWSPFVVAQSALGAQINLLVDVFGPDFAAAIIPAAADPQGAKCQASVTKQYEKVTAAMVRAFNACKSNRLADGSIATDGDLASCVTVAGGDEKVAAARSSLAAALGEKCAGVTLAQAFPGACAAAPDVGTCIADRIDCRVCEELNRMDGIAADCDTVDDGLANGSCSTAS